MIGEMIKALRKNKRITQKELADIIGVREPAVSLYETNKNSASDEIKILIAKYFNVSIDYLLGLIDDEVPYYSEDCFLKLPEDMPEEDKVFMRKFIEFSEYKKTNNQSESD